MVKTLKEAEERIRKAMKPPTEQQGQQFSPGIQRMRQAGRQRQLRPAAPRQLPAA